MSVSAMYASRIGFGVAILAWIAAIVLGLMTC